MELYLEFQKVLLKTRLLKKHKQSTLNHTKVLAIIQILSFEDNFLISDECNFHQILSKSFPTYFENKEINKSELKEQFLF